MLKKAASSLKLQNMLANHLYTTWEHISRLEDIFDMLGASPEARQSEALMGIAREAEMVIGTDDLLTALAENYINTEASRE